MDFVQPEYLGESFETCLAVIDILEGNRSYVNVNPKCEPQLGKRGLYEKMGGGKTGGEKQLAMLWVLNQSDGDNTLLDISDKSRLKFSLIKEVADILEAHLLLERI